MESKQPEAAGSDRSALGLTDREFAALVLAWNRHATPQQRTRAAQFLGALSCEAAAIESAEEAHARGLREMQFEEEQLCGVNLERRRAEPA
jgi:hypothetical protein